jgi:two-component system, NarL family, response regulator NreC
MTTIVLAEDHQILREGLRVLLSAETDLRVIGEAAEGLGVADLVERLRPDLLVVDLMMPGLGGLDVIAQVRQRAPQTRAIVLSMHADESYVLAALRNGAAGYVLKNAGMDDLLRAIRAVVAGQVYLSAPLTERAMLAYVERARDSGGDSYDALTPREREVLHLVAEGYTSAEIAEKLSISPRTAEIHRTNLMRKLDLHSQTDLVRYALRRGIISLD